MIDLTRTRIDSSLPANIHPSVDKIEDSGLCLVNKMDVSTGEAAVAPSAGDENELFVGFSFNSFVRPEVRAEVQDILVEAPGTAITIRWPMASVSGDVYFFDAAGTKLTLTKTTNAAGTTWDASAHVGKVIRAVYQRTLTVRESIQLYGNQPYGGITPASFIKNVGVLLVSQIFTTCFDPAIEWAKVDNTDIALRAGANGFVTAGTTGSRIEPPCRVIHVPTPADPFLGLYLAN